MIGVSKLYCGTVEASDPLRYGRDSGQLPSHLLQFAKDKKPVVVWNVGRRCNLHCVHCYSHSQNISYENELSHAEGITLLDDLSAFGVPVVLFSGGEPLLRKDIFELINHATANGMRAVISTNGTLITPDVATRLKAAGLSYVGISLDGLQATNDKFRGVNGAFDAALAGIRNCIAAGVKVGLRLTMTQANINDIDGIFDILIAENIPRICFYHFVQTGRGESASEQSLSREQARQAVDKIMSRTRALFNDGHNKEVLTVDNHCDGPYLYLKMLQENPKRAEEVLKLLNMNGGNSSGMGIGCVSWDGSVYPDQFSRHHDCGNVKDTPFSEIWGTPTAPLLTQLRDRKKLIKGRCATCKWLSICNANLRVRAEALTGDLWESDPACYLTDEEIGIV